MDESKKIIKKTFERLLEDKEKMHDMAVMMRIAGKLSKEELETLMRYHKIVEENGAWHRDIAWYDEICDLKLGEGGSLYNFGAHAWEKITGREWPGMRKH